MSCAESRDRLHAYLDDELDADQRPSFEAHLRACPECARELETQQALRVALRDGDFGYAAPAGLGRRVRTALRPAAGAAAPRPRISPALTAAAALLVGVGVGALGTYYAAPRPAVAVAAADPAQSVVEAHVRSLLGDNMIDVKSSNKHVVKPWLASRLDFSLPVNDFKDQGFPLQGGRLDFINERTAAVLIYDRGNHHINLFVWPAVEAGDSATEETSRRGYTLLHWSRNGLTYWAASDVNAADLREFVRLVQEAP